MLFRSIDVHPQPAGVELLCIATYLPVRCWLDVPAFMRMSALVERQLKRTTGLIRFGLRAALLRKQFWTLSVWTDRESVNSFVHSGIHVEAVRRFPNWAGPGAAFVEWTSADGVLDWTEASVRLQNPTFYYRGTRGRQNRAE